MKAITDLYLSYLNDFLTVETFARYHSIDKHDAYTILQLGKKYHNINCSSTAKGGMK